MKTEKYYLALEYRPNDFMPVDINTLLHEQRRFNYNVLEMIDQFTKNYSEEEIIEMIKNENLVPECYLGGKLTIINDKKYRYPVLTKDVDLDLKEFFEENINNKIMMNKFVNIYQKYSNVPESINLIKQFIRNKNVSLTLNILWTNSYNAVRNMYFYTYNKILVKEQKEEKIIKKDLNASVF